MPVAADIHFWQTFEPIILNQLGGKVYKLSSADRCVFSLRIKGSSARIKADLAEQGPTLENRRE